MKAMRAVLMATVLAVGLSACGEGPPNTQTTHSALTPACDGPSVQTLSMAGATGFPGTWNYSWQVADNPNVFWHGQITLRAVGNTGTLYGDIGQPAEWTPKPPQNYPWQWKIFGTQNGTALHLWAPPGEWSYDDPWYWDFTDNGSGTLTTYQVSGGWEHNLQPWTMTLTRVGGARSRYVSGTPAFCPGPTNTPIDGNWNVTWQWGGANPYPNCLDFPAAGCPNGGICNTQCTSNTGTVIFQSFNGAIPYVFGRYDSNSPDKRGIFLGTQNGTSVNLFWWPMLYYNGMSDSPWTFNGALDPSNLNYYVGPEATGPSGAVVQPGLVFSMTRQ